MFYLTTGERPGRGVFRHTVVGPVVEGFLQAGWNVVTHDPTPIHMPQGQAASSGAVPTGGPSGMGVPLEWRVPQTCKIESKGNMEKGEIIW